MSGFLYCIWHSYRHAGTKEMAKGVPVRPRRLLSRLVQTLGRGGWAQALWSHRSLCSTDGTAGCMSPGGPEALGAPREQRK